MAETQESDRLSVFLVEDNACDIVVFRQILRKCSGEYSLVISGDGSEAVSRLKNPNICKPDVVFLDLNLPGKSGVEVLREMKADPILRRIPVAVLTGSDQADDRQICSALGVDAYFNKAEVLQDFFALVARIQALLSNPRPMLNSSVAVSVA